MYFENNVCINFKIFFIGKELFKVRWYFSFSLLISFKFGKVDLYEKLEKLGEGFYVIVYKGKSKVNGKLVVLKVIRL